MSEGKIMSRKAAVRLLRAYASRAEEGSQLQRDLIIVVGRPVRTPMWRSRVSSRSARCSARPLSEGISHQSLIDAPNGERGPDAVKPANAPSPFKLKTAMVSLASDKTSATMPTVAIIATARDEGPYLLEWIAYHRVLGIRAFLIADNGGADNTSELLQDLHERGIIYRLDWRAEQFMQMQYYHQALAAAKMAQLDGVFLLDIDEFLRPEYGHSVSLIAARWLDDPTIGAVALNWAVYGSSGRVEPGYGLVTERFTRRAEPQFVYNRLSKPFVRVSACDGFLNPHVPALREGRYINTRGEPVTWMEPQYHGVTTSVAWDKIRIDHFQVKSRAECERKKTRGDAFDAGQDYQQYFEQNDRNEVDDPMPETLIERTRQEIVRIMMAPGGYTSR